MTNSTNRMKLMAAYLLLLLCHGAHVFEEAWQKVWWVKTLGMKNGLIINAILFALPVALLLFVLARRAWARKLSILYAVIMIMNGLWHNYSLAAGKYLQGFAIGSNTGIGLIVAGLLLIYYLRSPEGTPTRC